MRKIFDFLAHNSDSNIIFMTFYFTIWTLYFIIITVTVIITARSYNYDVSVYPFLCNPADTISPNFCHFKYFFHHC